MEINRKSPENLLEQMPLVAGLPSASIERLAAQTRAQRYPRGAFVFHRGELPVGLHLVAYGRLKLFFSSARGQERIAGLVGPRESLDESAIFTMRPNSASAQALEDALVLTTARAAILAEIDCEPRFARRLIEALSRRANGVMRDLEEKVMASGTQRVIDFLLRAANPPEGVIQLEFTLPVTKGTVASSLNLTQEHFSRILRELTGRSLIQVCGRKIRVQDIDRLRALAA